MRIAGLLVLLMMVLLMMGLPMAGVAQSAQPAKPSAATGPWFEGSLTYEVTFKGTSAADYDLLKPNTKMDMHIRNGDFIVQMYGGAFPKTLLYINDSNRVFLVDMANKRIFRRERFRRRQADAPKAVPTGDSVQLAGVWCKGYTFFVAADAKTRRAATTTTLYASPKYRVNMSYFDGDKDRSQAYFLVDGLDGMIPLKIVVKTDELETTSLAYKVTPRALPAANFRLPEGFDRANVDYRR